jgi:hypothetical protein
VAEMKQLDWGEMVVGLGGGTSGKYSVLLNSTILQYNVNDMWH